ncbi:MAG: hypothetical protein AAFS12_00270 [Cyanobacteria bacterium J06632_19]
MTRNKQKIKLGTHKTIINGFALALGLFSSWLGFKTPHKAVALHLGISTSIIGLINYTLTKSYESNANEQLNRYLSIKDDIINDNGKAHSRALQTVNTAKSHVASLASEIDTLKTDNEELQQTIKQQQDYLPSYKETLLNTCNDIIRRLNEQLQIQTKRTELDLSHIQNRVNVKSENIQQWILDCETLPEAIELTEQLIDELGSIRVQFRNSLNTHLKQQLQDSVSKSQANQRLEQYREVFQGDLSQIQQELELRDELAANNKGFVQDVLAKMEDLENNLAKSLQDVTVLKAPRLWENRSRPDLEKGNDIINFYANLGLILDRAFADYKGWESTLYFHCDRNPTWGKSVASTYNDSTEKVTALTHSLCPVKFELDNELGLLKCRIQLQRKPETKKEDIKLKDVLSVGNKRSWFVAGHPGAGKTSVMIYLGQQLGGIDAQRLALNPHTDDYSAYQEYGFAEITELDLIIEQILLLAEELKLRRGDKTRRFKLVVCIDELGAILDAAKKPKELMNTIRQIAVEGRKLEIVVIVGNHSETTKAIEMDGQFRSAFYQLFLVGAARYVIDQPSKNARLTQQQENHVLNTAYPALLLVNGKYDVAKHPTHGDYAEYQDSGNVPDNLEDWETNGLTIPITEKYKSLLVNQNTGLDDTNQVEPSDNQGSQVQLGSNDNLSNNLHIDSSVLRTQNHVKASDNQGSQVQLGYPQHGSSWVEPKTNPEASDNQGSQVQLGSTQNFKPQENSDFNENAHVDGLTHHEKDYIDRNKDLSTSKIVFHLWGIKASKAKKYQDKKQLVDSYK